jgi:hypothetical protein
MGFCKCDNNGLVNTGQPNCVPIFGAIRGLILVPTYDDSGVLNAVSSTANINDVFVSSKINNVDASKRWYPLMGLENAEEAIADSTFEEGSSGIKYFVKAGIESVTAQLWNVSKQFVSKIDAMRCRLLSVYAVDIHGNLQGVLRGNDLINLYPISIAKGSWAVKYQSPSESGNTGSKALITFDYSQSDSSNSANLRMLSGSNITANFLSITGLVDAVITASSVNSTSMSITASVPNTTTDNYPLEGILLSDLSLKSLPLNTVIPVTAILDNGGGSYDITYLSTPLTKLVLSVSKDRYSINKITVTTP